MIGQQARQVTPILDRVLELTGIDIEFQSIAITCRIVADELPSVATRSIDTRH